MVRLETSQFDIVNRTGINLHSSMVRLETLMLSISPFKLEIFTFQYG